MTKIVPHDDKFSSEIVTSLAIYACTSLRGNEREPLLKVAVIRRGFTKMKSVRCDAHEPTDDCVVHETDVCLSSATIA